MRPFENGFRRSLEILKGAIGSRLCNSQLYRGTVLRQSTATLRGHFVLRGDRGFKSELLGSDLVRCFVAVPLA